MRMLRIAAPAVLALALGTSGLALAADAPPAPKPGPENEKLSMFVGHWDTEGEMKPSPFGPGGKYKMNDHCEWFQGKFAVVCNSDGKAPTGPMKSLGILGYSSEEKVYTYYGIDNSGMLQMNAARGTVSGNTWTYTDESKMGGQMIKGRYTITVTSPTEYSSKWEMQGPDGTWNTMMTGTSKKKKMK